MTYVDLIGESRPMIEVFRLIERMAHLNSTVLIEGESGTGKELVARALHAKSRRRGGPFVAVNCATLPEGLVESELFGYEKGAFTGAWAQRKGTFEAAAGGTLFLDEIAEMSLPAQAKLLRALQEREIVRVGGTTPIQVDVRFIAATNQDLVSAVDRGDFREDLYYRLNVLSVRTPPLRERRRDIPTLALHFILAYRHEREPSVQGISPEAESILRRYDWPGNVRELQNVIQKAIMMGTTEWIEPQDLPNTLQESTPLTLDQLVLEVKRRFVQDVFEQTNGNLTKTAAMLRIHPSGIHRFLDRLNLSHLKKSHRLHGLNGWEGS